MNGVAAHFGRGGRAIGELALKLSRVLGVTGRGDHSGTDESISFQDKRLREARSSHLAARITWVFLHVFFMAVLCTASESPLKLGLDGRDQHTPFDDPSTPQDESAVAPSRYNYAAYTAFFFLLYFLTAFLYLWLSVSKPGYLRPGEGEQREAFRATGTRSDQAHVLYLADAPPSSTPHALSPEERYAAPAPHPADHSSPAPQPSAHASSAPEPPQQPAVTAVSAREEDAAPERSETWPSAGGGGLEGAAGVPASREVRGGTYTVDKAVDSELLSRWDPESGIGPDHGDVGPSGRYCGHCYLWQQPRVKHCYDCGRCVRRFDHHCVWVGNCVGRGNHRLFVAFCTSQAALSAWALSAACEAFVSGGPWGAWWSANTLVLLASIALGLMTATTGLLWVGQVYLVMTNQTTYEEQKEHSLTALWYLEGLPRGTMAFNHGPWANLVDFVTRSRRLDRMLTYEELTAPEEETWYHNKHYSCCG